MCFLDVREHQRHFVAGAIDHPDEEQVFSPPLTVALSNG